MNLQCNKSLTLEEVFNQISLIEWHESESTQVVFACRLFSVCPNVSFNLTSVMHWPNVFIWLLPQPAHPLWFSSGPVSCLYSDGSKYTFMCFAWFFASHRIQMKKILVWAVENTLLYSVHYSDLAVLSWNRIDLLCCLWGTLSIFWLVFIKRWQASWRLGWFLIGCMLGRSGA